MQCAAARVVHTRYFGKIILYPTSLGPLCDQNLLSRLIEIVFEEKDGETHLYYVLEILAQKLVRSVLSNINSVINLLSNTF